MKYTYHSTLSSITYEYTVYNGLTLTIKATTPDGRDGGKYTYDTADLLRISLLPNLNFFKHQF